MKRFSWSAFAIGGGVGAVAGVVGMILFYRYVVNGTWFTAFADRT